MKNIIAASVLMMAMSTSAHAQDMFAYMNDQDASSTIVLEPFGASADGYVVIYDYHGAEIGEMLGAARVREGANSEIRVKLGQRVTRDVIAVLFAGDDISNPANGIDRVEIDINN